MDPIGIVAAALGNLFKLPLMEKLLDGAGKAALGKPGEALAKYAFNKVVKPRLFFSSHELGTSLQSSYTLAFESIAGGLLPGAWGWCDTKVFKEFSGTIEDNYFIPICRDFQFDTEQTTELRKNLAGLFRDLAKKHNEVLSLDSFPDTNLAELVGRSHTFAISGTLLEQIEKVHPLDKHATTFLLYRDLLGNAMLHFFQEKMKTDARVKTAMETLTDQSLFEQLDRLDLKQDEMRRALEESVGRIERQLQAQQALLSQAQQTNAQQLEAERSEVERLQEQLRIHQQMAQNLSHATLTEAREAWGQIAGQLRSFQAEMREGLDLLFQQQEDILQALDQVAEDAKQSHKYSKEARDGVVAVGKDVVELKDQIVGMKEEIIHSLQQQFKEFIHSQASLSTFTELRGRLHAHQASTEKIERSKLRSLAKQLESLDANDPDFQKNAWLVAVALSAKYGDAGSRKQANELLRQLCASNADKETKAQAFFLSFQNALCLRKWNEAKDALEQAIALYPEKYKLHDIGKYPIKRIMSADLYGCIFLCEKGKVATVAVKIFWQLRKGKLEEVLDTAAQIGKIDLPMIPKLTRWGFADPVRSERPYVVMEPFEDGLDGYAYIAANGPLTLKEGLQVGLALASCLHTIHLKGLAHLDIKPSCVYLSRTSEGLRLKLLESGFTHAVPPLEEQVMRFGGADDDLLIQQAHDELAYAAPEQRGELPGEKPSPKSDLFGFGATMYWLMTQRSPKRRIDGLLEGSPEFYRILIQCMEEDPTDRPSSAGEVSELLRYLIEGDTYGPEGRYRLYLEEEFSNNASLMPFERQQALTKAKALGLGETRAVDVLTEWEKSTKQESAPPPQARQVTSEPPPRAYATVAPMPTSVVAEASVAYVRMRSVEEETKRNIASLILPNLPQRSASETSRDQQAPQGFVKIEPKKPATASTRPKLTAQQETKLIEVTNQIVAKLKKDASSEDFWNDSEGQRRLRTCFLDMLDRPDVIDDMDIAEHAAERVLSLARTIRHRFLS